MATVTSICNQALSRVGIKDRIADIDASDDDPKRKECKLFFDDCRDQMLRAHPWQFAQKSIALANVAGTPPVGWAYQYRYPSDCVMARLVTDLGGARYPTPFYYSSGIYIPSLSVPQIPFQEYQEENAAGTTIGRLILCDNPAPYLIYTKRVVDVTHWDAQFIAAFGWYLSANIGPGLKVDAKLSNNAMQMYGAMLNVARAGNLNEMQPDPQPDSPSIAARY